MTGYAVADPDLQIREGGGPKTNFPAFRASFCSKHKGRGMGGGRGGAGLPGPFPGSGADMGLVLFAFL